MASGEKALSEGGVVIEFAVVGYPAGAVLVRHRLRARRGEIHDRQSSMTEPEAAVEVESFCIWTAMS
jgi:hypothetical protein